MGSIVEFVLARIAEDEAVAREAAGWDMSGRERVPGTWSRSGLNSIEGARGLVVYGDGPEPGDAEADHIARHDPARVLAECEAMRRIVEMHRPKYLAVYRESERLLAEALDQETMKVAASSGPIWATGASERTLKALARPFADHPDYDEAWRP